MEGYLRILTGVVGNLNYNCKLGTASKETGDTSASRYWKAKRVGDNGLLKSLGVNVNHSSAFRLFSRL